MDAIEFFAKGSDSKGDSKSDSYRGGGYNLSKILKNESDTFTGGGGDNTLHIPLGLYFNQLIQSSTVLLDDIMKATVLDEDIIFPSQTRKNKLRFKTTKKHK